MLSQLTITNFAIIKSLDISFRSGLNILSGETGTGKSIIINAMNLILGGRASADLIRSGCDEARVEALFMVPENPILGQTLSAMDIPFDGELVIKRTIYREGRNKIFINGSMATLQMLSRLGPILISISGQHEHQLLLRPDNHIYLLDDFGGLTTDRIRLGESFAGYQELTRKIARLEKDIRDREEKQDLIRFQVQEIEKAEIVPQEDQALDQEKRRLQHAEELQAIISEGYLALYERDDSALSAVSQQRKQMEKGAEIDPRLDTVCEALAEIEARMEDVSLGLRDLRNATQADPQRLEEVGSRLEMLNRLKRKYGPTLEDVIQFREGLASTISDLDEKRESHAQLSRAKEELESKVLKEATALSRKRQEAAGVLERAVESELSYLHMENTRFQVFLEAASGEEEEPDAGKLKALRAEGIDRVEFMISPNVGEELRPLSKIASGGELSRIMLALKTILARTASVETIIFDEIDSGISGATAEVIGEKLLSLGRYHQMLCITHLPQIASQGETHYLVTKAVKSGRTQTLISELGSEGRVQEIARLLGGKEITPSAVVHAREMLAR
jgi:DNA repair protein RecN (Recombination protein N)